MNRWAIRSKVTGKYVSKRSGYYRPIKDDLPVNFYRTLGHAKAALKFIRDNEDLEIIRFEFTEVGREEY